MSNQSDENARFVTCRCFHCGGDIEFDANELNGAETAKVECPHCHLKTPIFAEKAPHPPPVQNVPDVLNPPPVKRRVVISIVT
jgi:DNA-directed RNA polymerase subunit RPC12/RpoP